MANKRWRWILAALAVAAMLAFMLSACGGSEPADTPPEKSTQAPATEEVDAPTTAEDLTEEDPTEETSPEEDATEAEPADETTAPADETTTATTVATARTPATVAEIVAFYNDAANRVKTQRLGYTLVARTHIDRDAIVVHNWVLNAFAGPALSIAERWMDWSEPEVVAPGASHNGFFVAGQSWSSRLQPDWVQSAAITPRGNEYHIRIVLRDERVPQLPVDQTATRHGQVMKVFTQAEIADEANNIPGIEIRQWDALYSGSYVEAIVCTATGNMKRARFFINSQVEAEIGVVGSTARASLPLAQEYVFTLNYR